MKEFNLLSFFKLIINKIFIILAVSVISAAATFVYLQFFARPTYMSKATIITSNGGVGTDGDDTKNTIQNSDIISSFQLIPTYVGILKTEEIFKRVAEDSSCGYTAEQLQSMVTVRSRSDSELFIDVIVVDSDPAKSKIIADSFIKEGSEYIVEMLPNAYARPIETARAGVQNYPRPVRTSILVFLAAAVVTMVVLVIISLFDRSIKGEDDFKATYAYPVLGVVPDYSEAMKGEK